METPLYKSYFLGKTKIMGYKSKHDVILNRNIAIQNKKSKIRKKVILLRASQIAKIKSDFKMSVIR